MNGIFVSYSISSLHIELDASASKCMNYGFVDIKCQPNSNSQSDLSIIDKGFTHWGRVTHICVRDLTSIGSDNDLSPGRRQAIIRTNAGILLIRPLGTNFSEILVEILIFSFQKMLLKVSYAKRQPFCLGLNQLSERHLPTSISNAPENTLTNTTASRPISGYAGYMNQWGLQRRYVLFDIYSTNNIEIKEYLIKLTNIIYAFILWHSTWLYQLVLNNFSFDVFQIISKGNKENMTTYVCIIFSSGNKWLVLWRKTSYRQIP